MKIKFLENEIKMLQEEKEELQDRINWLHLYIYPNIKKTEHFKIILNDNKKWKQGGVSQ